MKTENTRKSRGLSRNRLYKVKVVAKDSGRVLVHDNVPADHVELMKINPNLKVYIIDSKFAYRKRRE